VVSAPLKLRKQVGLQQCAVQLAFTGCPHCDTGSLLAWHCCEHLELPVILHAYVIFDTVRNFGVIDKRHILTFTGPCIVLHSYHRSQQDAVFLNLI